MTASEAGAVKGISDGDRKEKRKAKKNFQERLNQIQRERNAAVHEALNKGGPRVISVSEGRSRIAEGEKPFLEQMEKVREAAVEYTNLTKEEAKALVLNIVLDDDGKEIPSAA